MGNNTMKLIGEWTGTLFHENLCEYVEDEYFKIEILSISSKNEVVAEITEEIRTASLCSGKALIKEPYKAMGYWNPLNRNLRLSYIVYNHSGESGTVELEATMDIEERSMKGSYELHHEQSPARTGFRPHFRLLFTLNHE